jgi:hypothetical protein
LARRTSSPKGCAPLVSASTHWQACEADLFFLSPLPISKAASHPTRKRGIKMRLVVGLGNSSSWPFRAWRSGDAHLPLSTTHSQVNFGRPDHHWRPSPWRPPQTYFAHTPPIGGHILKSASMAGPHPSPPSQHHAPQASVSTHWQACGANLFF